jgi:hypothetical protein
MVVSLWTLHASTARADADDADVTGRRVELDDGTEARGTIVDLVPEDHVTLRSPDGRTTTIAWARVRRIERDAPAPALAPHGTTRVVPAVHLHIDSSRVVEFQHRPSAEYEWALACASPCDAKVPLADQYRIAGAGIRPSSSFSLSAQPGDRVRLGVSSSSSTANGFGRAIAIGGGVIVVLGLASSDSSRGIVIGLGVIAAAVGGVLVLANLDTTSTQSTVSPGTPVSPREPPRPTARGDSLGLPFSPSPALFLPIVGGTF